MTRQDILERKSDILKWIEEKRSKEYICKQLKCKGSTLNSYLKQMGITYFGQPGMKNKSNCQYIPASEYFSNERTISSHKLKLKLLKEKIKAPMCELCKQETWLDSPIPLELHHKDGNHFNNNLNNLQILCPNCHALQENNSGKSNRIAVLNRCIDCGQPITKQSVRCKSCAAKLRNQDSAKNFLTREEFKSLLRSKLITQIGRVFNVSDNAIRKWCVSFSLPKSKREIMSY